MTCKENVSILCGVTPHTYVIPAKAGIQTLLLSPKKIWIPAFAGMTKKTEDKGKNGKCEGLLCGHIRYYLQKNIRLNKKTSHCLQKTHDRVFFVGNGRCWFGLKEREDDFVYSPFLIHQAKSLFIIFFPEPFS